MIIDHLEVTDASGKCQRQLTARIDLTEKHSGNSFTAKATGLPGFNDAINIGLDPRFGDGLSIDHDDDEILAKCMQGLHQTELLAGEIDV